MKEKLIPERQFSIDTPKGPVIVLYAPFMVGNPAGFCYKHTNNQIAVMINTSYNEKVQNFALAHELMHINSGHMSDAAFMMPINGRMQYEEELDRYGCGVGALKRLLKEEGYPAPYLDI